MSLFVLGACHPATVILPLEVDVGESRQCAFERAALDFDKYLSMLISKCNATSAESMFTSHSVDLVDMHVCMKLNARTSPK